MSEAIQPLTRRQARRELDNAGYPDQALPQMGCLVPLDKDMNRWIENRSGKFELVTFSKLIKPAWLDPVIPWRDVGKYLRRQGRFRDLP